MENEVPCNQDVIDTFDINFSKFEGLTLEESLHMLQEEATTLSFNIGMSVSAVIDALFDKFVTECVSQGIRFKNDPRAWFNDG